MIFSKEENKQTKVVPRGRIKPQIEEEQIVRPKGRLKAARCSLQKYSKTIKLH